MNTQLTQDDATNDAALMHDMSDRSLQELHDRYSARLRSVVMKVLPDEAEASDILQDVFIQVWSRSESYSAEKGKLQSWLVVLAKRRACDHLRQRYAYRRMTSHFEELEAPSTTTVQVCPVDDDVIGNDLRQVLHNLINNLPKAQAEAVELAFFEGLSQRDIAGNLQLPLGTVKTRIELGLKKLAKALHELGETL